MRKTTYKSKAIAGLLTATLVIGPSAGLIGCSQTTEASSGASATSAQAVDTSLFDLEYSKRDLSGSYEESESVTITLADSGSSATAGSDCSTDASKAVTIDGSTVTINDEGTYILTGSLADGQVVVAAEDSDKVQLVLDGVTITNSDGPAICANTADKVFVTLANGSKNSLADGEKYTLDADSDEPNATLHSKCDLTINGSGTLSVDADYKHGILSKDELKITGGTITVEAVEDGIRGRDSLMIYDGTINVTAGDDALKSNNDEDASKGFIVIDNGTITVNAKDDAVHAETALLVRDCNVTIESCEEGYEATLVQIDGGVTNIVSNDDGINASAGSVFDTSSSDSNSSSDSASDGASDDKNGNAENATSAAGTDGKSSDSIKNVGTSSQGNPPSGQAPGNSDSNNAQDGSSSNQPPQKPDGDNNSSAGQQMQRPEDQQGGAPGGNGGAGGGEENIEACQLVINGGVVTIDAEGDALDSNGSIAISGGTVLASGSSGDVEVAMDYNGTSTITGGTVILAGSSGMAQSFSSGTQAYGMVSASGSTGQTISLADKSGNVITSYTPTNKFSSVVVSSSQLSSGTTYQVVVGGKVTGSSTDDSGVTTGGTVSGGTSSTFTACTESSLGKGNQKDGSKQVS